MAEAFSNVFHSDTIIAYSAGIEKTSLDQRAVTVMSELAIDISKNKSKSIDEIPEKAFDYVVFLCSCSHEKCPSFPSNIKTLNVSFNDPYLLSFNLTNETEALNVYRRIRDQIKDFIDKLK